MRNKSIQNTNVQTNTKVQRKDDRQTDRQTDRHMLRKFYSNLLGYIRQTQAGPETGSCSLVQVQRQFIKSCKRNNVIGKILSILVY